MRYALAIVCLLAALLPEGARAEDRLARLHAPEALVESGLLRHMIPRFSLKTQVRVELVPSAEDADLVLGAQGRPLFEGAGQIWHLSAVTEDPDAARFAEWLQGDVGQRTVLSFAPEGDALFTLPTQKAAAVVEFTFEGDAAEGHIVSRDKCRRCHAVDDASRMSTIGSTPSFAILRALPDWAERFQIFYTLNPHPAFMIIEDVTDPFSDQSPPPIVPIEMSISELEAMLAYVSAMDAADLGAPIQHQ